MQITHEVKGNDIIIRGADAAWVGVPDGAELVSPDYMIIMGDILGLSDEQGAPIVWTVPAGTYDYIAFSHEPGSPILLQETARGTVVVDSELGEPRTIEGVWALLVLVVFVIAAVLFGYRMGGIDRVQHQSS